ncbi:hypothetical protein A33M_1719 [Rhodovulum sp. PH10]|nr:hypothetical protein A33M_1719 [Rhodovulum sp. PH10]
MDGKDPWHLAPWDALRAVVRMLGHGADKHDGASGDDWRRGRAWSDDWAALHRHLAAWWLREGPDAGSGRSHLWHAGARIVILIAAELRGIGRDDRPVPDSASVESVPPFGAPYGCRLVYLATPYTRYPDGMIAAFEAAADLAGRLVRRGVCVYSPIAHSHPLAVHGGAPATDHEMWMRQDAPMLAAADALYVAHLPGWDCSQGVAHEIAVCEAAGKPIYDLDPVTLEVRLRGAIAGEKARGAA